MGLYIPQKSDADRLADYKAAKAQIEQIDPTFVFILKRGSPLPDPYDNSPEACAFRRTYQALRATQLHF